MVHFGKHIIDPKTGLCEICDRGAIYDIKKGKRHGKQFLYSNQDGKFTYRPNDEDESYNDEPTPRIVHKPPYSEPPPSVKSRGPVTVHRTINRRNDHSPSDAMQHRHPIHPAVLYHIDSSDRTAHKIAAPSVEPNQHFPAHGRHPDPPTRPVHVVHRRARTPPPPRQERNDHFSSPPRRKNNSDTRLIERRRKEDGDYVNYQLMPRAAEMYYIESPHHNFHTVAPHAIAHDPFNNDKHRKQRLLEPVRRTHGDEPAHITPRNNHKKLPADSFESRRGQYEPSHSDVRAVRKVEKIYPTPRQYESSPHLANRHLRSPLPYKNPSLYHIQATN